MPLLNTQQPNVLNQTPVAPEGRRRQGTGFTNIQNLLKANVGAGQTMGMGVGSSLGQKAGKLSQDVTAAGQKFQQQMQQQQQSLYGPGGALSGVRDILPTGVNISGTDISNLTPEQIEQIRKNYEGAQYTGPSGLENETQLLARAGNLQALGQLAGSQMGQGRLLQSAASRRGQYTRGQGLLDQMLIGQDTAAQEAIKGAAGQAFGTATQTKTTADVTGEQAKSLESGIEKEKAAIKEDVLKSLGGLRTQAETSAKQYLGQAERIKNILGGEIKPEDMTIEDRVMLSKLSEYGIDPATITTIDEDTLNNIITQMGSSANVQFTNQQKYDTEAERTAARNLALLSGQKDIADQIDASRFEREVFDAANKAIESGVKSSTQRTEDLENQLGWKGPEQAKQKADYFNAGDQAFSTGNRGDGFIQGDSEWGIMSNNKLFYWNDKEDAFEDLLKNPHGIASPGSFIKAAADLLGKDRLWQIYQYGANGKFLGGKTPYRRNFTMDRIRDEYRNKLATVNQLNNRYQSRTSLQDYINTRFGVGGMSPSAWNMVTQQPASESPQTED